MSRSRSQVAKTSADAAKASGPATNAVVMERQEYSGQIPPPSMLRDFDLLVPGTAVKIIGWAEDEQRHRRALELGAQAANIEAQRRQISVSEYQSRAVFRSDVLGQLLGFVVCAGCLIGAFVLAWHERTAVALAFAAIPTAAIINAFRNHVFGKPKPK